MPGTVLSAEDTKKTNDSPRPQAAYNLMDLNAIKSILIPRTKVKNKKQKGSKFSTK